jgi:glycosyltransferase involved in cell wall biosynthesis
MSWLVVTPARNEADRLPLLAESLRRQQPGIIGTWVVVDDGSSDGTGACARSLHMPFPVHVLERRNDGGLSKGSAFGSFLAGAEYGLRLLPSPDRVLKLDADVVLADGYLGALAAVPLSVGLVGGEGRDRPERALDHHVRGSLKAYSRAAFDLVATLPPATGFDVLDEVLLRAHGHQVQVVASARATVTRRTGTSEGLLEGRRRGGMVARWTGYHPAYFLLRLARYALRRPVAAGALAMAAGYITAPPSPFPADLRRGNRAEQAARMRAIARHPGDTFRRGFAR